MAADSGRDDFIIAIRSAFLKKGTRQNFSLFTLLIISILMFIYSLSSNYKKYNVKNIMLKNMVLVSLIFTIIQIFNGVCMRFKKLIENKK